MKRGWLVAFCFLVVAACGGGESRVVVAAGTTLVDSGVLDLLAADYEAAHPDVELSIVPRPTAEVLALGDRGAADVLVTHAPEQEAGFLIRHPEATATRVFNSRFILLAPAATASQLSRLSVTEAFARVASEAHPFITRLDGSGTYDAERRIWKAAAVEPDGRQWYEATGSGMGFSLQVADQTNAVILAEAGSFLAAESVVDLVAVPLAPANDPLLINPYTATVPGGASATGADFVAWLVSPLGQDSLARANADLFETAVFTP